MKNIITIALNDLRVFFSDKGNFISLIGIPIAMTILVGISSGGRGSQGRIRADVLDLDQTAESVALIETLRETNPQMYLCPLDDGQPLTDDKDSDKKIDCGLDTEIPYTLELGQKRVTDGDTSALIAIPEGYGELFGAFQPVMVTYYSLSTVATGEDVVQASLSAALQRVNGAVIAAQVGLAAGDSFGHNGNPTIFKDEADRTAFTRTVYDTADALLKAEPIAVEVTQSTVTAGPQATGFSQSVPGMGSMFVMFTVLGGIGLLMRERKQWTLQRLVTMPLTRGEILGGKILAYFTLGMIQYVIVFAVGFLTGTPFGSSPLALIILMMSFCLCITALTFALATRLSSDQQAQGLTLLLSMTLAPLGGAWWPLSITPPIMQAVGHLSPVAWVMDGFNSLIFFNGGLTDILLPVGVLLAASAVLFAVGIMGFKYE